MDNKTPVQNPFADEKPQIVHFEKDQSHYEYCRVQMHEIERAHRRTFIGNLIICITVCLLGVFQQYIGGFSLLSKPDHESHGAFLALGIFQILTAFIIIVLGYLAWANFHTLNIILAGWYVIVTVIGIYRTDYLTAVIGVVGVVLYVFAMRAMSQEGRLSEMEGYPNFVEKLNVEQSDIIIQTLLAHKGEHRTKSTLFTTDYSLRRKKKKSELETSEKEPESGAEVLAQTLKQRLDDVRSAKEEPSAAQSHAEPEQKQKPVKYYIAVKDCELGIAAAEPDGTGAQIVYSEQIAKGTPVAVTETQVLIGGIPSSPVSHFRAGRYPEADYQTRFDESDDYLKENLTHIDEAAYSALTEEKPEESAQTAEEPEESAQTAEEPESAAPVQKEHTEPEQAAEPESKPEQKPAPKAKPAASQSTGNPQRKKKKQR